MNKFICESPILQEAKIIKIEHSKAIFRMVLQTLDEINQNGRLYPTGVVAGGLANIKDFIDARAWLGETDHPLPSGNEEFDMIRQTTVQLKEASHLIRDYEIRDGAVIGELETLSTRAGRDLLGLLKDNIRFGMSLRGMAGLETKNGYKEVIGPLMVITYDAVSRPSHKAAVVNFNEVQFQEAYTKYKTKLSDPNFIHESQIIEKCNGRVICTNEGICYLSDTFDKLIERNIIKLMKRMV